MYGPIDQLLRNFNETNLTIQKAFYASLAENIGRNNPSIESSRRRWRLAMWRLSTWSVLINTVLLLLLYEMLLVTNGVCRGILISGNVHK